MADNTPLYNSRIIQAYVQLIRRKHASIDIGRILEYAGIKPYEIEDQGHWFTQSQIDRFHEKVVETTGDDQIAREAGRYTIQTETIGAMRQYMIGEVTPIRAYEMIEKASVNFTRSSKYVSRKTGPNKIEITVTPHAKSAEKPFQCENRMGCFEAVLSLFKNNPPKIEHPECIFRGDKACRYVISWERSFVDYIRMLKRYTPVPFLGFGIVVFLFLPPSVAFSISALFVASYFSLAFICERFDRKEYSRALINTRESTSNLIEQIEINYNNRLLTREIGQVLNRHTALNDVLDAVVDVLKHRLDYDRGMLMLANKNRTRLAFQAGYGYTQEQHTFLDKLNFHLDNPGSRGVFVLSFKDQKPFLVNDVNDIQGILSRRSLEFARRIGAQSFICCPIICDNESLGILAVDNIRTKRTLVQSDMYFLMGISHIIGISIRHTEHLEAREQQLKSILKVMVSSIDARDPVTKGHSEWVSEYSAGICDELGLDREYREVVRISALLHDYGKIGVPDAMLKKAARLTDSEYEYIKCHAEKTYEILSQINFEGKLREVPAIASAHHERIDGSGYPKGLRGDEIPLGARIIAVADFFEALTASRYYNTPLSPETAMRRLEEKIGSYFERRIVYAFIRHYRSTYLQDENRIPEQILAGS